MKRPTLTICTSCESDDEHGDGRALFEWVKQARRAQELKPWFRLKEAECLGGCDTPCNARLKGSGRQTVFLTWLDAVDDGQELLDAARRYSENGDTKRLPGRPG